MIRSLLQKAFLHALVLAFLVSACSQENNSPSETENQAAKLPAVTRAVPTGVPTLEILPITPTIIPSQMEAPHTNTPTAATHQNPRYNLKAELDYDSHKLAVSEQIHYINNTPEAIPDLLLMVEPAYYPNAFKLNSITWENGEPIQGTILEGAQLRIPLSAALKPGEQTGLSITYELDLPSPEVSPNIRPIPFGYTDRQTNLVDWYPFIPPYIPGKGWLAHEAGYYGEHLAYEVSDFHVEFSLASNWDDLKIAASAPDEGDGETHRYTHENARGIALSVSHNYQVFSETVGDVTVYSYAFPHHAAAGETVLRTTIESLELYSKLFGPYPHKTLSAVEADFLDGMEYDGLYFLSNAFYNLSKNIPGEYLTAIAAHETAHQWFYALVANDQALEPWLDEALCTYSERIYYETYFPEALVWWWNYRINYYQPGGWVNDSIYNPHGVPNAYRAYRDAVYLNGAVFMEELRTLVGDESFYAFLNDYVLKYSHKIVSGEDFFSLLQEHTDENVQPLVEKYFLLDGK